MKKYIPLIWLVTTAFITNAHNAAQNTSLLQCGSVIASLVNTTSHFGVRVLGSSFGLFDISHLRLTDQSTRLVLIASNEKRNNGFDVYVFGCVCMYVCVWMKQKYTVQKSCSATEFSAHFPRVALTYSRDKVPNMFRHKFCCWLCAGNKYAWKQKRTREHILNCRETHI